MQTNARKNTILLYAGIVVAVLVMLVITFIDLSGSKAEEPKKEEAVHIPTDEELFPSSSAEVLGGMLRAESAEIRRVANDGVLSDKPLNILQIKLFGNGEWCGITIAYGEDEPYDEYRIILNRRGDEWKVVTKPELCLSYAKYPDIPKGLIRLVNQM